MESADKLSARLPRTFAGAYAAYEIRLYPIKAVL